MNDLAERSARPAPSISVVIPAFEAASTIVAAVSSAFGQTVPPTAVIVVDDGSTDGTADRVRRHHPRAEVVTIAHGGEAAARNAGLRTARTEWVAFLDADDRYLPERLAAVAEVIEARPELDAVTTDAYMEVDGDIRGLCYGPAYRFADEDQQLEILRRNFVFGHVVVRRQRLLDLGGFDESISHGTDWAMWLDLVLDGGRIGFVDRPLAVYRVHAGSASADRVAMIEGFLQTLARADGRSDLSPEAERVLADSRAAYSRDLERARLGRALAGEAAGGADVRPAARTVLGDADNGLPTRAKAALAALGPGPARRLATLTRGGRTVATAGWLVDGDEAVTATTDGHDDPPLVSVIIPFLDEVAYLAGAVETVLDQSTSSWELLLVDDGSTDGSGELADEMAAKDPGRIRVLRHPGGVNRGLAASGNLGLSEARAGAIAFLHADDRWEPSTLETRLADLARWPSAGMVTGPTRHRFLVADRPDEIHPVGDFTAGLHPAGRLARALAREAVPMPPPPASVLYRASALRAAGGVPPGNSTYEDQRAFVVVSLEAPTLITDDVLTTYARRPDSIYGRLGDDNVIKSRERREFEWWVLRTCLQRARRRPRAIAVAAALVGHRLRSAVARRLRSARRSSDRTTLGRTV